MWKIFGRNRKWKEKKEEAATWMAGWIVALLVRTVRMLGRTEQRFSIRQKKRFLIVTGGLASAYLVWLFASAILEPAPRTFPELVPDTINTQQELIRRTYPLRPADSSMDIPGLNL